MNPILNGAYGSMFFVDNMAKTVSFYKDGLGLKPRFESAEWTEFDVNGFAICLHALAPGETRKSKGADDGILITNVKDIQGVIRELRSRAIEVSDAKEVFPGAYSAHVKTPDGHFFSIYENTRPY
jgi:hypothetical protein